MDWIAWTSADGVSLMARDYPGSAERLPVVCLHGLTRNSRDFEAVAPWIAGQGRRVLAADVRGRGRSGYAADPTSYQPRVYVADLVALLDKLVIPQVLVVGTSMGGMIAMRMAADAPQRLGGAVLNDIGPELAPEGLERIGGYAGLQPEIADWADAADYARAINGVAFPDYGEADWAAFARRIFRQDEDGRLRLDYDPRIGEALRAAEGAPAPDPWLLFDRLAESGRALLLVRGALSDLLSPAAAAKMRERAPQTTFAEVPRVGHAPMLTEPAAQAAIAAFLARAP
jgi:pimeloyl-ACP methyl ester carboxylesterase